MIHVLVTSVYHVWNFSALICFESNSSLFLYRSGHLNAAAAQLEPDKNAKTPDSLEKYASERWEVLLHYLVGTQMAAVSGDIKDLLIQCGLMK